MDLSPVGRCEEPGRPLLGPAEQARRAVREDAVARVLRLVQRGRSAVALDQVDAAASHAAGRRQCGDEHEHRPGVGGDDAAKRLVLLAQVPTEGAVTAQNDLRIGHPVDYEAGGLGDEGTRRLRRMGA